MRGTRLVSRKFRSSCCSTARRLCAGLMFHWLVNWQGVRHRGLVVVSAKTTLRPMDEPLPCHRCWPPPARRAGLALPRRGAGCSCRAPSTARWPATRAWPSVWPRCCRAMPTTRRASSLRRRAGRGAGAPPRRLRALVGAVRTRASPRSAAMTAAGARGPVRPAVHRQLPRALPVQPLPARAPGRQRPAAGSDGVSRDRPRRQPLLRPDRLVRRQPLRLRLLQGCIAEGSARARGARPGAGRLPPGACSTT
jgi:hypothetical protein